MYHIHVFLNISQYRMSDELGYDAVVVRPGRLVGAPFTNFDLAKLLNLDQGSNKGIIIDKRYLLF